MSTPQTATVRDAQEIAKLPGINSDLLTLTEVRILCRIGRTTLWRWIHEQGLRTVSVLGIRRIRRRDLDAFLEGHSR
jgi:excisionase family DNA binding protein